jgi:DNA-directed RNA polymerase specialized sigma24 family protein
LPVSVFSCRKTSPLESAVRFLRENRGMRFCDIGRALGRDARTVWSTYHNAVRKSERFHRIESSHLVPSTIFLDRRKSFLESLVIHMRGSLGMGNKEISETLNRDQRTISTVYHRAVKKQVRITIP